MTFTDKVNDWISYFKDEYIEGDNNIFKIPMDEDESEEQLDDKELDEIVSCVWSKNGWLYLELNVSELDERYREKMKQWKYERDEMNDDYFNSRF